jgi:hypothetical protein
MLSKVGLNSFPTCDRYIHSQINFRKHCVNSVFHGGEYEADSLLGYGATLGGQSLDGGGSTHL